MSDARQEHFYNFNKQKLHYSAALVKIVFESVVSLAKS
jgi:hypothetical protein